MKIRTSYFYQIRNFKKNMIPISTAIWDPKWYHDFTRDYGYVFYDKRGILNGLRSQSIIAQGRASACCPCDSKDYTTCNFLKTYRKNLNNIDFDKLYSEFERFAQLYKEQEKIDDEIIIVLIVYEVPSNPCSERLPLQEYFNAHGVECKELDYPIKGPDFIKDEPFDF